MTGDRLNHIARRLLREHSYATIVAPAIADLQHEAALGRWPRVRAYAAVWRAVAVVFASEIIDDWCIVVRHGGVWRAAGAAFVALIGLTAPLLALAAWNWSGWYKHPWHHTLVLFASLVAARSSEARPPTQRPVRRI